MKLRSGVMYLKKIKMSGQDIHTFMLYVCMMLCRIYCIRLYIWLYLPIPYFIEASLRVLCISTKHRWEMCKINSNIYHFCTTNKNWHRLFDNFNENVLHHDFNFCLYIEINFIRIQLKCIIYLLSTCIHNN